MEAMPTDIKLDFSDVLIVPKTSELTSRADVRVDREFKLKHAGWDWAGVPIIAANMDTTGTIEMANALSEMDMLTALHKHYTVDELITFFDTAPGPTVFYSMGTSTADFNKLYDFTTKYAVPKMICLDVANGYTMQFLESVKRLRDYAKDSFIMAGNVVTGEKTEQVILAGADCAKVGIGPGSVCTTRKMTGVGYPQLSAIIECAQAAHGVGGLVCGDGGLTVPGDLVKAFGAGADFVMIGGMFSGTDETPGEIEYRSDGTGRKYKKFYGMSSKVANDKYAGGLNGYRAAEGKEVLVPYKGPVADVVSEMLGGLRSGMTYVGATRLKELTKRTQFIRVNNQLNNSLTGYEV